MPLQNRVDPFGAIHAVPERGMFTGNRGIIHDPDSKTLLKKRWALHAWIICVCEFRGRRRVLMGRNRETPRGRKPGWTELFFLDEPTALAGGHRPCFYCQRERATEFARRFGDAFGIAEPRAPQIDTRLHKERFASSRQPLPEMLPDTVGDLPDGVMVAVDGRPYALKGGRLLPWSFAGYGEAATVEAMRTGRPRIALITPMTSVATIAAGFRPIWHPSAGKAASHMG